MHTTDLPSESFDELATYQRAARELRFVTLLVTVPFVWFVVLAASMLLRPTGWVLGVLMFGHLFVMLDVLFLSAYLLMHLARNERLSGLGKLLWFGAFWVFGGLPALGYLFWYVFDERG